MNVRICTSYSSRACATNAPVARRVPRPAGAVDLGGHRLDVGAHVERRAVGEERAVRRVEPDAGRASRPSSRRRRRARPRSARASSARSARCRTGSRRSRAGPLRPPGTSSRSSTVTSRPAPARRSAADSPASPAPTTTTRSVGPLTVRIASRGSDRADRRGVRELDQRPGPRLGDQAGASTAERLQRLGGQPDDEVLDAAERSAGGDDRAQVVDARLVELRVAEPAPQQRGPGRRPPR